jgi:hypothetical protein
MGPQLTSKVIEQRAFLAGLDIEFDAVGNQVTHQATVQVSGVGSDFAARRWWWQRFLCRLDLLEWWLS